MDKGQECLMKHNLLPEGYYQPLFRIMVDVHTRDVNEWNYN